MNDDFDFAYLKSISNGDAAFELTMIESLTMEIEEKILLARASLAAASVDGVRLQAHSLKNLFAILGLGALQNEFLSMESACHSATIVTLCEHLQQCDAVWQEKKNTLALIIANYQAQLQGQAF